MKKFLLLPLLALGLLFSGCEMTVPLNPSLLMLLKNDGPPPKLEIVPAADVLIPANQTPAETARENAASLS